ncbi:hypothetical protein AVEN_230091-1 [Araneus ventricosus]|uniref:Uncharacterized protein n=1 Tax=Araneus ventricosus TaxID=182803 RepID=A0A4Y2MEL0_ARAVE|nr:hypothetical protein AVEN_230091-1 [Araneus ventricosus]
MCTPARSGPRSGSVRKTQQKFTIPLGSTASPDPKIPTRRLCFLSPEQPNIYLLSKPNSTFFISPKVCLTFNKAFKIRDHHSSLLFHLSQSQFRRPSLTKLTFCILLRVLHCPVPDTLATLPLNDVVRPHLHSDALSFPRHDDSLVGSDSTCNPRMFTVVRRCCYATLGRLRNNLES